MTSIIQNIWPLLMAVAVVPLVFYLRAHGNRIPAELTLLLGIVLGVLFAVRLLFGALTGEPVSPADLLCLIVAVYMAFTGFKERGARKGFRSKA